MARFCILSVWRFAFFVSIADNSKMNKHLLRKLAIRLKELREQNNYTQDDLSAISGVARSTIGNVETASNDITLTKLKKLANAFKLSLSEFLNF